MSLSISGTPPAARRDCVRSGWAVRCEFPATLSSSSSTSLTLLRTLRPEQLQAPRQTWRRFIRLPRASRRLAEAGRGPEEHPGGLLLRESQPLSDDVWSHPSGRGVPSRLEGAFWSGPLDHHLRLGEGHLANHFANQRRDTRWYEAVQA